MDMFNELAQHLENINDFKRFIDNQLELDNQFLYRAYWLNGQQVSVLNYLIHQHDKENKNLTEFIQTILEKRIDIYLHQPFHLLLKLGKLDLLPVFLARLPLSTLVNAPDREIKNDSEPNISYKQALNSYDINGQTILAHAINLGNADTFSTIIGLHLDINQASETKLQGGLQGCLQPLQHAIAVNFPEAVSKLLDAGACADNLSLEVKDTALLLAAHSGSVDVLKVLLNHPKTSAICRQQLNHRNDDGYTAIDLLCLRLQENIAPKQALQGIAILLCHGATTPSTETFRNLLNTHRVELVKAVKNYTIEDNHSSIQFLRASHDKNNSLHDIIYTNKTWSYSVKKFFGISDRLAFKCEKLVLADSNKQELDQDEKLFAIFVKRYREVIKRATIYSPWSEMLWKITTGQINSWEGVCQYAKEHPKTRTARIVAEMTKPQPEVYVNLTESEEQPLLEQMLVNTR
ncbi:ankyrin repeat domain-containing protein [Legionella sp. CNM-1927-20]|uniref:ankyrin repeat domain-containing protein n=1 Tax=Legionella sp. CNM-1927-20 TaxID=3422221 RepID=UPI00403AA1F8